MIQFHQFQQVLWPYVGPRVQLSSTKRNGLNYGPNLHCCLLLLLWMIGSRCITTIISSCPYVCWLTADDLQEAGSTNVSSKQSKEGDPADNRTYRERFDEFYSITTEFTYEFISRFESSWAHAVFSIVDSRQLIRMSMNTLSTLNSNICQLFLMHLRDHIS
jgi:hypothetical protein